MTDGWWVRRLDEVPTAPREEPDDPDWHPLQHHFGLTTVGLYVYRAQEAAHVPVGNHDETSAGHEELYYVTEGRARFVLDGVLRRRSQCPLAHAATLLTLSE